jgi:hypothetical protein
MVVWLTRLTENVTLKFEGDTFCLLASKFGALRPILLLFLAEFDTIGLR